MFDRTDHKKKKGKRKSQLESRLTVLKIEIALPLYKLQTSCEVNTDLSEGVAKNFVHGVKVKMCQSFIISLHKCTNKS